MTNEEIYLYKKAQEGGSGTNFISTTANKPEELEIKTTVSVEKYNEG